MKTACKNNSSHEVFLSNLKFWQNLSLVCSEHAVSTPDIGRPETIWDGSPPGWTKSVGRGASCHESKRAMRLSQDTAKGTCQSPSPAQHDQLQLIVRVSIFVIDKHHYFLTWGQKRDLKMRSKTQKIWCCNRREEPAKLALKRKDRKAKARECEFWNYGSRPPENAEAARCIGAVAQYMGWLAA